MTAAHRTPAISTMSPMGLASQLDYRHSPRTRAQGFVLKMVQSRPATAILRPSLGPLDRATRKLTRGKTTASDWLAGLPPLWLTTTGARSGEPRVTPLYGIPIGDDLALMGTSFGQRQTPGWVYNLEAHPRARVTYREVTVPVVARRATEVEEPQIWDSASQIYAGYRNYLTWAAHREIRVFVLELA